MGKVGMGGGLGQNLCLLSRGFELKTCREVTQM